MTTKIKSLIFNGLLAAGAALLVQIIIIPGQTVLAVTPPDNCFDFSAGTISEYYDYEDNNNANPACPQDVDIPNTIGGVAVTTIDESSFGSKSLTGVTIPDGVTSIGRGAFALNDIDSLQLPDSVNSIGTQAFAGNQITNVRLPSGLANLEVGVFLFNRITRVDLPASISSISPSAFAFQNPAGGNVVNGSDPSVYLFSGDPTIIQNVYDSIWYAQLFTASSLNSESLTSNYITENGLYSFDINGNGTDESIGGHLIDPASATLAFQDTAGNNLQATQTLTGILADSTALADYRVVNVTNMPTGINTANPSAAEQAQIDAALSVFYRVGQNFSYDGPVLDGLSPTPNSYSFALASTAADSSANNRTFVYGSSEEETATPGTGSTNGDYSVADDDSTLADTGTSLWLALSMTIGSIILSIAVLTRISRMQRVGNNWR